MCINLRSVEVQPIRNPNATGKTESITNSKTASEAISKHLIFQEWHQGVPHQLREEKLCLKNIFLGGRACPLTSLPTACSLAQHALLRPRPVPPPPIKTSLMTHYTGDHGIAAVWVLQPNTFQLTVIPIICMVIKSCQ